MTTRRVEGVNGRDVCEVDYENYRTKFPFTGTIKQVAFYLSDEAIHDAEADTRHGLSKQ